MKDYNKGRVIITSSRNIMALAIARSLGEKGIEVIGADCIGMTLVAMSKFTSGHETYTDYEKDKEAFLDDLEKIVHKHKPGDGRDYVLIPVFKETRIIVENHRRFEKEITIAAPSMSMIDKIFPKDNFARTTRKYGVPTPSTWLPESLDELEKVSREARFPILSKPYNDSGGRGIQKIEKAEELKDAFKVNEESYDEPPLFQGMADGEEYCMTAIYQQGEMKAAMVSCWAGARTYSPLCFFKEPKEEYPYDRARDRMEYDMLERAACYLTRSKWGGTVDRKEGAPVLPGGPVPPRAAHISCSIPQIVQAFYLRCGGI